MRYDIYQGDQYLGAFDMLTEEQAIAAAATQHQLDPSLLHVYKSTLFGAASQPAAPVSDERSRRIDAIYRAAGPRLRAPRSALEAKSDEELQDMLGYWLQGAAAEAKPDEVLRDQMKHKTSMRRVNQPALEPAGVVHMRSRRSGKRRYRAQLWDSDLQVATHLGVFDTLEDKLQAEEAARQRRAMGLPVRMD